MNATDETPEPFSRAAVLELGRAAGALGIDGESIAGEDMKGSLAGQRQRRDDRNLLLREVGRERVLFEDLRIGPTVRPVELRDARASIGQRHLIDAILVAAE